MLQGGPILAQIVARDEPRLTLCVRRTPPRVVDALGFARLYFEELAQGKAQLVRVGRRVRIERVHLAQRLAPVEDVYGQR